MNFFHRRLFALCFVFAGTLLAAPRPQIKISDFVAALDESGELDAVIAVAAARIEAMIPDPILKAALLARLKKAQAEKAWFKLDRFPVIPLAAIKTLRPALGGMGNPSDAILSEPVHGDLREYLGRECYEKGALPKPVHASLRGVTDGHFPNPDLSPCEVHQSFRVAKLLNTLVQTNGSVVNLGARSARTPEAFMQLLIDSGHTIQMRNERTYANFLSLNADERPIIWPVWLDTGLKTSEGDPLIIPMGHSHHAWRIAGPIVNARVTFYLGVSGVGFFAQADERPAWTGLRAAYTLSSHDEASQTRIAVATKVAGVYAKRVQREAKLYAQNMPADGYGYLGVCNDSNAVLEASTIGTVSTYPLMRAAELDQNPNLGDGLDSFMRRLPKDTEAVSADRSEKLLRIGAMFPFTNVDDPALHDETLRGQMRSVFAELGR